MKLRKNYICNRDIDWFVFNSIKSLPIHLASAGGDISKDFYNSHFLRFIQYSVVCLPDLYEANELEYNESFLKLLEQSFIQQKVELSETWREDYLQSFKTFAIKGFCSCDRLQDSYVFADKENLTKCSFAKNKDFQSYDVCNYYIWVVRPKSSYVPFKDQETITINKLIPFLPRENQCCSIDKFNLILD